MTSNEVEKLKTCFVVMPITTPAIYVDQDGDSDHFAHVLDDLFIPALENLGYQVLLPSVAGSELIHAEIVKNLEQADLVLCDLSSLNPNVFFELGIRTALDRPIVLVRDKLTPQIPFDLAAINVFTYNGSLQSWIVKDELPQLAAHIKASIKSAPGAGNAMWRYFGLTKPASPAQIESNPLEAKVDFVISELTNLQQRVTSALIRENVRPGPRSDSVELLNDYVAMPSRPTEYVAMPPAIARFSKWVQSRAAFANIETMVTFSYPNNVQIVAGKPIPDSLRSRILSIARDEDISVEFALSGRRG